MNRPTYAPILVEGRTMYRTSDGSTFATEADARLYADPHEFTPGDTAHTRHLCSVCHTDHSAPRPCDTCGAPSTAIRTEGGSTPTYILCAECASAFDEEVARSAEVAERHAAYHPHPRVTVTDRMGDDWNPSEGWTVDVEGLTPDTHGRWYATEDEAREFAGALGDLLLLPVEDFDWRTA